MAIEPGIKGYNEEIAAPEKSAKAIASGDVDVYATPMMILLMENTCEFSVRPYLEPGFATVGSAVNIKHLSATPVGMKVWCESELIEVDGRRLVFSVKAYDQSGLIGEGTHERFIVNVERFMAKTQNKLATV